MRDKRFDTTTFTVQDAEEQFPRLQVVPNERSPPTSQQSTVSTTNPGLLFSPIRLSVFPRSAIKRTRNVSLEVETVGVALPAFLAASPDRFFEPTAPPDAPPRLASIDLRSSGLSDSHLSFFFPRTRRRAHHLQMAEDEAPALAPSEPVSPPSPTAVPFPLTADPIRDLTRRMPPTPIRELALARTLPLLTETCRRPTHPPPRGKARTALASWPASTCRTMMLMMMN